MKALWLCILLIMPNFIFSQSNSVLSTGDWYKISVQEEGVYKITYSQLESYGMDLANIDPREICLYGNPNGMLPEELNEVYYSDLQPIAITISGEYDGVFNETDYILFYAQGITTWKKNEYDENYYHTKSIYENKNYYFITIDSANAKRIEIQQSEEGDADIIPDHYSKLVYHELDIENPGKTGKQWIGERFDNVDSLSINIDLGATATNDYGNSYFKFNFACKSQEPSSVDIYIQNVLVKTINMPISPDIFYDIYRPRQFDTLWPCSGSQVNITLKHNSPNDDAKIWLDYIDINAAINNNAFPGQINFNYLQETDTDQLIEFNLFKPEPLNLHVWNIDNPMEVRNISAYITQNGVSYKLYGTQQPMKFISFTDSNLKNVYSGNKIDNQNLHALTSPDLLIITNNELKSKAEELAEFHETYDGISSSVVTVDKIYNEFSSGSQDVTAIRNFIRYLWEKSGNSKPENVLLFGEASYDYLDRIPNNTNMVPTHESYASRNTILSFADDNYYVLIDEENPDEIMVGVGRIPVSNTEESTAAIEKIKRYYSSHTLNKWKNNIMLIADDGDSNLHERSLDEISDIIKDNNPDFNIINTYLDFFEIVETEEGYRYPQVNNQIKENVNEGVFIVDYTGHGGENILANEIILSEDDIQYWTNFYLMPIFIVSSGNISKIDDPESKYLGEKLLLEPNSAGIATLSLTGWSFMSSINRINTILTDKISSSNYTDNLHFGDLMKGINLTPEDRKWSLLGDPAIPINMPEYQIKPLSINDINIESFIDTIAPGSTINLKGEIVDRTDENLISNFNGTINLTVYTPPFTKSTLANQEGSYVEDFIVQDSILSMATAEVINGEFTIETTLPSEYYEGYGKLKLSWYAFSSSTDASGAFNDFSFGGVPLSIDENLDALKDVKVYPSIVRNNVNIQISTKSEFDNLKVKVYNITGSEMAITNKNITIGNNKVDLSALPPGLYIMNLSSDLNSKNYKLIKQ